MGEWVTQREYSSGENFNLTRPIDHHYAKVLSQLDVYIYIYMYIYIYVYIYIYLLFFLKHSFSTVWHKQNGWHYTKKSWWRHEMEIFPRNWPFVRGIHQSPVNSPHKSQWRGALMFSLICAWINDWVNNREAGDLRRYRAHYVVIVMWYLCYIWCRC